jgi:hypothetical protein
MISSALSSVTNVLQEQPDHPFALTLGSSWVTPEARKVRYQRHDLLKLVGCECSSLSRTLPVVVLLGSAECAQFGVPLRLQRVSHKPVVRIDAEVAPLRKLRFVASALHLLPSHRVNLLSPTGCLSVE